MQNAPKGPTPKTSKAIHYNENVEEFARSGKVEESARKAKEALDDDEQAVELQRAETKGRSPANRPGSLGKNDASAPVTKTRPQ